MRCTDHTGLAVSKQQRSAVSGGYADRKVRHPRDDRVGTWTGLARPRLLCDDDIRRVDLKSCEEAVRIYAQRSRHACTVLGNFLGGVPGANPAIQGRVHALRYAAGAREEGVSNAWE